MLVPVIMYGIPTRWVESNARSHAGKQLVAMQHARARGSSFQKNSFFLPTFHLQAGTRACCLLTHRLCDGCDVDRQPGSRGEGVCRYSVLLVLHERSDAALYHQEQEPYPICLQVIDPTYKLPCFWQAVPASSDPGPIAVAVKERRSTEPRVHTAVCQAPCTSANLDGCITVVEAGHIKSDNTPQHTMYA